MSRISKEPERFGERLLPYDISSSESEPDIYKDNSDDDSDYFPTGSQKLKQMHLEQSADHGQKVKKKKEMQIKVMFNRTFLIQLPLKTMV